MITHTNNTAAASMVMHALEVLKDMQAAQDAPGWLKSFSPLAGHLPSNHQEGKSQFNRDYSYEEVRELMLNADNLVRMLVKDGPRAAVIFTFHSEVPIGWNVCSTPLSDGEFEVRLNHGELQVFGPAVISEQETHYFSAVLTPEKDGLALASVHPGIDDPDPKMEGLKEGDNLTFDQLLQHKITRVNKI